MSAIRNSSRWFLLACWSKPLVASVLLGVGVFALVGRHKGIQEGVEGEHFREAVLVQHPEVAGVSAPMLIAPADMVRLVIPRQQPIELSWTQAPGASQYRVRIFRDPEFHTPVYDRTVATTGVISSGLVEGLYYWVVQSIDAKGKTSGESGRSRFFLEVNDPELSVELELLELVRHGHVIQVRGKTQPLANVMVNGQPVPVVTRDGLFDFFTPPLGDGENTISVTAQNSRGGVRTIRSTVTLD